MGVKCNCTVSRQKEKRIRKQNLQEGRIVMPMFPFFFFFFFFFGYNRETKTSVMVVERHLPGSSHHDPSLVNPEEKVTTCTIRPCDSVCPDYFVKTSKNEFISLRNS